MATPILQPWSRAAWQLARRQHGVVARSQLRALGMPPAAVRHRLEIGRLHELHRGVYAVGRPQVGRLGELTAAVLACGAEARLSHGSGAELWGIRPRSGGPIEVTVPPDVCRRRPGLRVHRWDAGPARRVKGIPVGDPVSVLIDLATCLPDEALEAAVNEADGRNLVATPRLRAALDSAPSRPGVGRLRRLLDAQTFSRSQTALERRFLAIALAAGLPKPAAQERLGRYRVDFHWPRLSLVVETDSLTYHRTVAAQTTDLRRDQAHARAGLRTLRFNHAQVFRQPEYVREVLADAVLHLGAGQQGAAG
jgi:very-short-patch-repair endonuclease